MNEPKPDRQGPSGPFYVPDDFVSEVSYVIPRLRPTEESSMTYPVGYYPPELTIYHRHKLAEARSYLESIAKNHPEWIVRKARR